MYYLIQENLYSEKHHETLIHNLERMGLEYELVKLIPFVNEIDFKTDRKDVFVFGAIKMAHIANTFGFVPGSMHNKNHDLEVYGPIYGQHMLNHGSHIMKFDSPLPEDKQWDMFFGRSCEDDKAIPGQVFMRHSWNEYIEQKLDGRKMFEDETQEAVDERMRLLRSKNVMISPLKEIVREVRCWIVGGKVITMSEYKIGRRVVYKNVDHEDWLREIVQHFVDIYQPAEAFVMDVCEVFDENFNNNGEVYIVEINCINCAGFYDGNTQLMLNALEEHFNK